MAFKVVTAQTPALKTRTIVPWDVRCDRLGTARPSDEQSAYYIVSSSACSHQAPTHTLYRQRDLCAIAHGLEFQDSALDPILTQPRPSEPPLEKASRAI